MYKKLYGLHVSHCIMKSNIKASVIGGDSRFCALAEQLSGYDVDVVVWGLDVSGRKIGKAVIESDWHNAVSSSSLVILPLPVSQDNEKLTCWSCFMPYAPTIDEIIATTQPGTLIFGGMFRASDYECASKHGVRLIDYYREEEVIIRNAVPSAEGAVAIAMNRINKTIDGSQVAVIGYGRLGRVLADVLSALGANVTVAARNNYDLAWIKNKRFTPLDISAPKTQKSLIMLRKGYDIIFNTVPCTIFDSSVIPLLSKDTLYIDLASLPGGFDSVCAEQHKLNIIHALSIPGRYAPVTAGGIICDYIVGVIRKEEII